MSLNLDSEKNQQLAVQGIIIVCIVSVLLRFWGLDRFNEFVFDEVYYAKFANNYLTGTKFFNSHPPLSQYLIAIGIWIGDRLPFGQDTKNLLTGSLHSTFSYRWMNALFGSFIPPVVAAIAYQLSSRLSYAFLAALLISFDGLFLVDSRYALNNIYLILFGLIGQLCVLMAIRTGESHRFRLMILAGISFGASLACKWNGLWFLTSVYILILFANIWKAIDRHPQQSSGSDDSLFDQLARIRLGTVIIYLGILPIIVYSLLWIPHLIQNPSPNFIDVQLAIFNYHDRVGNGTEIHPYCANWYTWPLLMRPLAYYFNQYKPDYYHDVHAMGNPVLWWLAFAAILGCLWYLIKDQLTSQQVVRQQIAALNIQDLGIPIFILTNYAINLLPWAKVTRCLFIYHYMGAVLFAIMGLAWFVDRWLRSNSKLWQAAGLTTIFIVAASFVFWLPVHLGLPIAKNDLYYRLWDFWIFNWI